MKKVIWKRKILILQKKKYKMYKLLKYKYKIQAIYDPCSYPGIQSKFHYDPLSDSHNGIQTNENTSNYTIKNTSNNTKENELNINKKVDLV